MRERKIKFCSNYPKLWNQESAILVAVRDIKINKETHPDLLEYDTKKIDGTYFPLKSGNYIQLLFIGNKGIPFCTIRSAFPTKKIDYYKSNINQMFKVEVQNDGAIKNLKY